MNRDLFRLDEISIRGLCMELLGNLWMILLAGLSMFFLATGWHNLTYQPQYTSSATLVVTLKGEEKYVFVPLPGVPDGGRVQPGVCK